jgi:release factor glutamine methyltransferase
VSEAWDPGFERSGRDGETWTILRLIRWSGSYLEGKGVGRGRLDAEHLLAHALGLPRLQLYLQFDRPLARGELDRFRPLLRRRAQREPLQYILGHAAFRDLDLGVDRRVLIPRPETEVLVEEVLRWARIQGREDLSAVDLGTGSGAIALSLATEGPFSIVVATDSSEDALAVAVANTRAVGLDARVQLRHGSLFEALGPGEAFDVVVSNPPYVADSEAGELDPEVGVWEPGGALFGGADGTTVLTEIVAGAGPHLRAGGLLALEVGSTQAPLVLAAIEATGGYEDACVRRDLTGRDRVILARAGGVPRGAPNGRG